MQKILKLKVKFRESFRPFAPSILREELEKWFDLDCDSPYMLLVAKVKKELCTFFSNKDKNNTQGIQKLYLKKSIIPAVTHVDYTSRIQTVHIETNPLYYKLISKFYELTGCPILVNTSFNVRGEPLVCSPEDAFNCFMGTELDLLVIDNFYLEKNNQTQKFNKEFKDNYLLD